MNTIKNSLKTVKTAFEGVPFLKFMVTAGIYIFAAGGLIWLVAGFIPVVSSGGYFVKTLISSTGRIVLAAGLLFAMIKSEELLFMIVSGAISVGALVVAIIEVASFRYLPSFESWLFFIVFGGLAALVLIFGDKFKDIREQAKQKSAQRAAAAQAAAAQAAAAQAAAAQQVQLIECPNCKGPVPINAAFCPNCGAPNPAMQQYQQAPPQAPPQAQPVTPTPPPAPVAPAQEAPPAAPAAPAQEAPPVAPVAPAQEAPPVAQEVPATKNCAACGASIPQNAAFCGQCGAKQ